MTDLTDALGQSYVLRLRVTSAEDPVTNSSTATIDLAILKGTGTGRFRLTADNTWTVIVDDDDESGNVTYDFRPLAKGQALTLAHYTKIITHDEDGTKTISVSASFNDKDSLGLLDGAITETEITLPTIARTTVRVGADTTWVLAEAYAGINGEWIPAQPRVGVDDAWTLLDNG